MIKRVWCGVVAAALWGAPASAAPGDGFQLARSGRIVSYASFVAPAVGGVMAGIGVPLRQYNSSIPWYDKAAYDRRYLRRLTAADALQFGGLGIGGTHLPLFVTGVMMEAHGLRRIDPTAPLAMGWVGTGLLLGAVSATPLAFAPPVGTVAVIAVASVGYAFVWVQFGQNVATVRHLAPEDRERLRRLPRKKVQLTAAPWLLGSGGGALVAGIFP